MNKRALLTGGTGYIGSNLSKHLIHQGWDVHIVVRQHTKLNALGSTLDQIIVHRHDGSSNGLSEVMSQAKPDVVFHLASLFLAQHKPDDIAALISSNVLFPTQLLDAMDAHGVKYLVNTGTAWQHLNNQPFNPVNLYAATKQAFEDILAYYVLAKDIKVTTLCLFDTYGPSDPRQKLVSLLWNSALSQQPLRMSPGEQLIDLVHIDDVVCAFTTAADIVQKQTDKSSRYGVSSGQTLRLIDLVEVFEQATGLKVPITWGALPYRPREVMIPWNTFSQLPNWKPSISLAEGLPSARPLK